MEDQERQAPDVDETEYNKPDVEAHKKLPPSPDVEGHRKMNDEPQADETGSDDEPDVEAHKKMI
jgi:hypothetical protein